MKKLFLFIALLLPIGAWADDDDKAVIAGRSWTGPYWFNDEGTGATCGMSTDGITITNPQVQDYYWTPQMSVLEGVALQEGHSYKVIVTAKVPSSGQLYVQLGVWDHLGIVGNNISYDRVVYIEASDEFQDYEFEYEDFSVNTKDAHILFQTGYISGTSVVKNVKLIDLTDDGKAIAERDMTGPYWFNDEGTGSTWEMTSEGMAIINPQEQSNYWSPQTSILEHLSLQQYHSYKVIITAKVPSSGLLYLQLGIWDHLGIEGNNISYDRDVYIEASNEFKDYEFEFNNFSTDTNDAHILLQNGYIPGTSIIKNVKVIDLDIDLGDADNDGDVDKDDIDTLVELIMSDTFRTKADMNKDGKVDAVDLVLLINILKM